MSLEERVLKLEEENDLTIREHEQKMLAQKDTAEQVTAWNSTAQHGTARIE